MYDHLVYADLLNGLYAVGVEFGVVLALAVVVFVARGLLSLADSMLNT